MKHTHAIRWFITLGAAGALLLGACTESEEAADSDPTPTETATATVTPISTEIVTVETSPTADPNAPTTTEPPGVEASSGDASVPAGLGSYCWTPAAGSGQPGICADAIGIITAAEALPVAAGADVTLETSEEGGLERSTGVSVQVWPFDPSATEPASGGDWGLAWQPPEIPALASDVTMAGDSISFAVPEEPGNYLVSVFVTFPNGDAMYGLQLEVE